MELWNGIKDSAVTTMMGVSNKLGDVRGQVIESTTNWAHGKQIPFEWLRKYFRNQEVKQRRMVKIQEYRRRYSRDTEQFGSSPNLMQNMIVKGNGRNLSIQEDTIKVPAARRFRKSSAPDILINSCVSRHNLLSTGTGEKRKLSVCEPARNSSITQLEERKKSLAGPFYIRQYSVPERSLMETVEVPIRRISSPEQTIQLKGNKMKTTDVGRCRVSIQDSGLESLMIRRESFGICGEDSEEKKCFTDSQLLNSIDAGKSLLASLNTALFNHPLLKLRTSDTAVYPEPRKKIDSITDVDLRVNQIQMTIHHEHKPNLLTVTIHRVRILEDTLANKSKIFATVNLTSSKSQKKKSRSIDCEQAKVWEEEFIFKKMTIADLEESSIEIKMYRKMKFPKFPKYHSKTIVALCDVNINDFLTTTKDLE
ncbi:hypothetical protein LOTGIDRAFT_170884 [Lottia gigantea]|uniref:C2 domain-containing protein n=1 Tax=Lottia gigantea TaxID=225164 RepID=V4AJD3_LOTGI|nr:hypothetical protein LOTGIDRAFT_170884 [Lottia gigantea]ESP04294.1 hypothetical protein LOTGIDRAFT_170884 [Lottia gigantea]